MTDISLPVLDDIYAAHERLRHLCHRTPLIPLNLEGLKPEVWLKCENLQPIGAYKNRPQGAVMTMLSDQQLEKGVYTASSGNSGLGMAWCAREMGVEARCYVPEGSAGSKIAALERLGTRVITVSYDEWWATILNAGKDDDPGAYIDAVRDPQALAGDGTIGLEIFEDLPDVDTVVCPFGGGGLTSGVAGAMKTLKPDCRIVAAEVDTAAPLTAAFDAGKPVEVTVEPSFIQAIGAARVLDAMWPLLSRIVSSTAKSSLRETCDAIRILFERHHLVAEGAGAVGLAATLAGRVEGDKIVCIISGGNLDPQQMVAILEGGIP